MPGESLTPRLAAIHGSSIAGLIAQVERHLASNPNDARGWEMVAPVYLRLGRYDEAVNARRKILALRGANAEREADLGEALMAAANGVVTDAAKAAFDKAAALGPKDVKSHFYTAVAAEQDGKRDQAVAIWRGVLADAPPGASWADNVREVLAQLGAAPNVAAAPGPSASNIAAVSQTSEQDRSDLIQSIVARLPEKLKQYGSDIDSWQRLLRGYIVLGERGKAAAAANDARHALAAGSDKLKKIDDMIKSLGLDG
jgi:cytochrome c-type biogenesis protein CcmH